MRKLKSTDAFKFMRIVKQAKIRDEFMRVALLVKDNPKMDINKIGADLILGIFEGLANEGAEKEFYKFASGILEQSVEELEEMDILDFFDLLKSYKEIEDKERWKAFFTSVASLMS